MAKNIIYCSDGTWNHPAGKDETSAADTNVLKMFRALRQSSGQEPHYDDGVGADGLPIDRLLGGAIGEGLFRKIKDGYTVIARSYDPGDDIYLFGFSRGAYTARSLAGMISICGLPGPGKFDDETTEDAFKVYRDAANRKTLFDVFEKKYAAQDVKIAMVGVWDTVGALGIPGGLFEKLDNSIYGFLDTKLHPDVKAGYHAVAIDERRREFTPTLWSAPAAGQELEQVWFTGVHRDVGGSYEKNGLSDISLGWMIQKAAIKGLAFDPEVQERYSSLDAKYALAQMHNSWDILWGFPEGREIPQRSTIANSVAIRIENIPSYRPPNLPSSFPTAPNGLTLTDVIAAPVLRRRAPQIPTQVPVVS